MDVVIYLQASMRFPLPRQPCSSLTPGKWVHAPEERACEWHRPRRINGQVRRWVTAGDIVELYPLCSAIPPLSGSTVPFQQECPRDMAATQAGTRQVHGVSSK